MPHYTSRRSHQECGGRSCGSTCGLPETHGVGDFRGLLKGVENLPADRERFSRITTNFRNAQQDILETFLDRGELHRLRRPTVTGKKRIPGLKLDNARQLALMHALVAFSHVLVGQFSTADLYPRVQLRAKELVEKIPGSHCQLTGQGYRLSVVYLKLFEKTACAADCRSDAPLLQRSAAPHPTDHRTRSTLPCRHAGARQPDQ